MSKELPFFKFIATDWLAGDIQVLNLEEQGFFINLCALFWKKKESLAITALKLRYSPFMTSFDDAIKKLKELDIITVSDDEKVTVLFLEAQFEEQFEKKQKLSNAGKKGAKSKYKSKPPYNHPTTTLQPPINKEEIDKEIDKDKEKEIKEKSSLSISSVNLLESLKGQNFEEVLNDWLKYMAERGKQLSQIEYDNLQKNIDQMLKHYTADEIKRSFSNCIFNKWNSFRISPDIIELKKSNKNKEKEKDVPFHLRPMPENGGF